MADVSVIVDTDGSSGDYSSLALAEAGEQVTYSDLVGAGNTITFNCQATTGVADVAAVTISGWTTGVSNGLKVIGNQDTGIWDTSKYRLEVDGNTIISADHVTLEAVQLKPIKTGGSISRYGFRFNTGNYGTVKNCIIDGSGVYSGAMGYGISFEADSDDDILVENTVVFGFSQNVGSAGIRNSSSGSTNALIQHNTVYNCSSGIFWSSSYAQPTVNNAVFSCADEFRGSLTNVNYCASVGGEGSNSVTITQAADNYSALVTDAPGGDFSPTDASSELVEAGEGGVDIGAIPFESIILPINLNNLSQSHSLGNLILTQKNTLSPANLNHAMALGTPTLSVVSSLIVQGLNHAHSLTNLGLIQKHNLIVSSLAHLQSIGVLGLIQKNALALSDLHHGMTIDGVTLSQADLLTIANLIHTHNLGVIDITQAHNLGIQSLGHSHSLGGVSLSLADMLSVASLLHSQGIDNFDITQAHNLAINNLTQAQDIGSVDLAMALLLEVAGLTQDHSLDTLNISSVDVLAVDNMGHVHNLGSMDLTQAHELLVNDMKHSQNISAVSFVTTKGRVTITMSMKVPVMNFEMKTPNINFEME